MLRLCTLLKGGYYLEKCPSKYRVANPDVDACVPRVQRLCGDPYRVKARKEDAATARSRIMKVKAALLVQAKVCPLI
jgi:hypothetical protein